MSVVCTCMWQCQIIDPQGRRPCRLLCTLPSPLQAASYLRQFESSEDTFPVKVQVSLLGREVDVQGQSRWSCSADGVLIRCACCSVSCPCAAPRASARPPHPSGGMRAQMANHTPRPILHPCPMQVPLMWTVYLQLAFRHFVLLGPDAEARQPGFFEVWGRAGGGCGGLPCVAAWHGRKGAAVSHAHAKHSGAMHLFLTSCLLREGTTPAYPCCMKSRWAAGLLVADSATSEVTGLMPARRSTLHSPPRHASMSLSPCLAAAAAWLHAGSHGGRGHRVQEGGAAAGAV